jgi:CBS-domain-containing membrane protein
MSEQNAPSSSPADSPNQLVTTLNPSTSAISVSRQQHSKNYQDLIEIQQQQINQLIKEISQLKKEAVSPNKPPRKHRNFWRNINRYLAKINIGSDCQPRFSLNQILFSYIGSFIGIATLAYLSVGSGYPLIAAPFGAAAVLVFAVPDAALAQPRNLIIGNFLGAVVSVVMVFLFGSEPWVMALAVATAIKLMQLTKTLHPPGGAVALVGVMSKAEASFIFTPVFLGSVILLVCTIVFNNLMPGRSYPKR